MSIMKNQVQYNVKEKFLYKRGWLGVIFSLHFNVFIPSLSQMKLFRQAKSHEKLDLQ